MSVFIPILCYNKMCNIFFEDENKDEGNMSSSAQLKIY